VDAIMALLSKWMLYPAVYGAYTELYAGLSPDLTIEKDQAIFVWPWGRRGTVRPDISAECKTGGNSEKLYEWCERETGKWL
jgi:retinol dehydrogenase-12